ncbi:MAG TPA: NRDE family protein [Flavobacteriales bacterium]
MCLILVAYRAHPRYPLIVAANRDEAYGRSSLPLHWWRDRPSLLAGKDLVGGGTWLGMDRNGRFAALTNHRDLGRPDRSGRSRGGLVLDAFRSDPPVDATMAGYNLLHGHWTQLKYQNNIDGTEAPLQPGVHGLSNALLDTPWPKVVRSRKAFEVVIDAAEPAVEDLFSVMIDADLAPDAELPSTGLPLELERALSAPFIRTAGYGTRCSTVVMVDAEGNGFIEERSYVPEGRASFRFRIGA